MLGGRDGATDADEVEDRVAALCLAGVLRYPLLPASRSRPRVAADFLSDPNRYTGQKARRVPSGEATDDDARSCSDGHSAASSRTNRVRRLARRAVPPPRPMTASAQRAAGNSNRCRWACGLVRAHDSLSRPSEASPVVPQARPERYAFAGPCAARRGACRGRRLTRFSGQERAETFGTTETREQIRPFPKGPTCSPPPCGREAAAIPLHAEPLSDLQTSPMGWSSRGERGTRSGRRRWSRSNAF